MTSYEVKTALERIHGNEYPTKVSRVKEFFTKGFQINRCYEEDWDEIKTTFRKYNIEMNAHGPIITISQKKYIKLADELTEVIKTKDNIRSRIAVGVHYGARDYEKKVDGLIFITILRILPMFSLKYSERKFREWIQSNGSENIFGDLIGLNGTIKSTDQRVEDIIEAVVGSL